MEISHDLTTDSFIEALTRFFSRRRPPIEIYSDNGTNFKGAEAEIKTALEKWNLDRMDRFLQRFGIKWTFIPPQESHARGVCGKGRFAPFGRYSVHF